MKKMGLAMKIGRKPWSLFIRNIPPFFTCNQPTNQPTKQPTYFNQEKNSDKCTHMDTGMDNGAITEYDDL